MKAAAAAFLVLVAGCDSNRPDYPPLSGAVEWTAMADGSRVASFDNRELKEAWQRCWPREGGGFACVRAVEDMEFLTTTVDRTELDELPGEISVSAVSPDGYSCYQTLGVALEKIELGGNIVQSNRLEYRVPRWSAGFVDNFVQENAIDGPGHYGCLEILDQVLRGSPATLGTTAVTAEMAGVEG